MKKFFALFALILIAAIPLCLVGCKSKYDNLKIEMESSYNIVLGENDDDSITVEARVTGNSDENSGKLSFSPDNDKLVKISQEYKNGINYITLKALAPGKVNIEARTLEGGVTKTFVVNIIQPIKNFTVKSEKFWAVRGGEWKIDIDKNLNLEPVNTTQTDFVLSFGEEQSVEGLAIENNVLRISKDSMQDEIVLNVHSTQNPNIAPKEIKLNVLDDFVEIDKQTQATQSKFVDGDILVFEKNPTMSAVEKLETLNIISNLLSESQKQIVVRVFSAREVDVSFESNSKLSVKKVSSASTFKASGEIEYTDFVFSVRFADAISSGVSTNLNFVARYVEFDLAKHLSPITIAYELAPKTILVNDQSDLSEFTLYDFYSTAKKGQKLQFGVLPSSVSSENSKMKLLNKNNLENVFEYLQFFRDNGEEIFEGDVIYANQTIYARAKTGVKTGSFEVLLQTEYVNPTNKTPLTKTLKFNVLSGITDMNFEDDQNINIQLNSEKNYAEILFDVAPANVDITKIHIEDCEGLSFSTISTKTKTAQGLKLKFLAYAQKAGQYEIKIYSENGIEITKSVNIVNSLESVSLSAPSPGSNSAVGDRQIISGELRYLAISLGGAVSLEENILPQDSKYRTEYSYFETENMPEYALSTYDYPNTVSATSVGVLDYSQLLGYKKIVALKQGYAVVRIKYIPIGISNNAETELEPIYKYFIAQGYRPIRSVVMSSNYETLYSLKSVGVFNKNLTMTKIQLSVFPNDATYAKNIVWSYDDSGEYFEFDEENLTISAIRRRAGTMSIVATIKELNRTYTQTLSLSILDAKMVSDVSVIGVGDSIYIENVDDTTKTYVINAIAFPNDAFNTNLRYDFVDKSGNIISNVNISREGVMTIPAGLGLDGFVRIAAEDCFQKNDLTGAYEPIGTEGKNIIYIPTIIANGTSKDTAIRINNKDELKNIDTKKHYIIQDNLDVSGISFENFSGGLYGYDSESRVVLSGFDRTFIQTLAKSGCIEDIQVGGNINFLGGNGVLVGRNEGIINNVFATGEWSGKLSLVGENFGKINETTSEVVFAGEKFAGIALSNSGEIYNCSFMGAITASHQAAGITIQNSGLLDGCSTLLNGSNQIKLSSTFDTQAKIAGVCVENSTNGSIIRCYIYSYKTGNAFFELDFDHVAGFVFSNYGTLTKSLSALLDVDKVSGFVYENCAEATIENCYSNTTFAKQNNGTISKCYSVFDDERLNSSQSCYSGANATEKTVSDWLNTDWDISSSYLKTTIWKIYMDSQNPFLREVVPEVKPGGMTVSIKRPQKTNPYIKLSERQVLLFYYEPLVLPLTSAEKAKLNQCNSVSIYDLLKFEMFPNSASSSPDMFNFTLSDGSAIKMSGQNINVVGLGKQTLTITSKLNTMLQFSLDIYTSYPIRDFNIYESASSLDPSGVLLDGTIIYLKRTYTQALYSKISSSIVLVDREISFKTHDIKINYPNSTELQPLGLYLLQFDTKQKIDDFPVKLDFSNISPYDEFEDIRTAMADMFVRKFRIVVYNGAESLSASQYSFEMEPIDTIELNVYLKTDVNQTDESNFDYLTYNIYNEQGIDYTNDYFSVQKSYTTSGADDDGFKIVETKLIIQLRERTTQISGNYYIRIYANEEGFTGFGIEPIDIAIKLLPQSIQRIDYSHYYATSKIYGNKEVLESNTTPSNAIAPGQVGLLEINVFPTYSQISHVEIESIPNQGNTVRLQLYSRFGDELYKFSMVQQNVDYSRTENGIVVGYTMINNGTIYLKTQINSDIPEELIFELVVRAYRSKKDTNPIVQHIFLAAKFIPTARIEIDGQKDYVVMGRGTTKNMTITVVGEGDVEIHARDGVDGSKFANAYERAYVGQKTLVSSTKLGINNQFVYSCPVYVGSKFKNNNNDIVTIEVVVFREINGVRETKTTTLIIRVLDFVVNNVVLKNGTNKYNSKVSVKTKFDFSYDISEPQSFTNAEEDLNAVKELKANIDDFKNCKYFTAFGEEKSYIHEKTFMYVDSFGDHLFATTDESGKYSYKENEYVKVEDICENTSEANYLYTTLTGLKTGTLKMKLQISAKKGNNQIYSITYEFDVVVTNYSNEDKPMPIGSLDDFNAIFEQSDAQDYILTSDIEIGDHTAFSDTSKIRSLDGNNHKIIIKSLVLGKDNTLDVALFKTISEITTIKNLIIDYQIGEINANSEQYSQINVAGLALTNNGIVTNTHVLSTKGTTDVMTGGIQISSSVAQSTQIQMAGFVLDNSGSITNSRVGDTSVSIVDTTGRKFSQPLKIFALVGQDQMAGFVLNNTGIISSSYAKNITISNNSKFESDNKTAGFVLNNQSGAKITGSYVKGVEGANQSDIYVDGLGIESSFEVAGFVYDNYSIISDCYSNIKLYKELPSENRKGVRSAGFVYKNEIGAQIVSSLSLSKIVEDDTSQEHFCGVDDKNESNNFGTIAYSYYYSSLDRPQSVADGAKLLDSTVIKQSDQYYGYSFTNANALDGMWVMTSHGPDLVAANNIALSKRYLVSAEEDKYNVAYVVGYEYGSLNNPILIRSAKEFNDVFGTSKDDSIKQCFDSSNKQAFGNYRIINDIDLSDLSLGGNETTSLSSTSYTLMRKTDEFGEVIGHGVLDGNSMTISNLDISITDTDQIYYGLFASIKNGAVVKNLNLTVKEISASSVNYVGALAGYVENSKIINVSAEIASGQQIALVQGRNIVGGIVGAVAGTSELNNISSSISAHATYVDTKETSEVNRKGDAHVNVAIPTLPAEKSGSNSTVSIAGSIAGAIYAKDLNNEDNVNLSTIDYAQIQKLKVYGKISINAKIAGGIVGYVGKTTYLHDAWLSISDGQNINVHSWGVGGGAVGICYGKISHVRIEHNDVQDYSSSADNLQTEIEKNVEDYYTNKSNERKTYENMFNSTNVGQTLGGIIGVMNGGILEDSYSKLDVISDVAYNLGGIVGIIKNQKYEISRVYTFSNVQSKSTQSNVMVGGLFGAVLSSGELDSVVGANYLDKNYSNGDEKTKSDYVKFMPFAGACTYVPKMSNVYTLSSIWNDKGASLSDNKGANISAQKDVNTLLTRLGDLFPASKNPLEVNNVFEIEDSHFKNSFWARNVDDVLPHLTFGLEDQYFIIDNVETANDIRKMLKNSNKTFYIDGRVTLTTAEEIRAMKEVREGIIFTGKLLGIPDSMRTTDQEPTLVGMQELFNHAIGATFSDFAIENPQSVNVNVPSANYGLLVGGAKDCSFTNITVVGTESSAPISALFSRTTDSKNKNVGGLAGLCEGKTSFENITIDKVKIQAADECNIGLVVGKLTSIYGMTTFKNCMVKDSSIQSQKLENFTNENVGGLVGSADGVEIINKQDQAFDGISIDVAAQNVGGLVGNVNFANFDTVASRINISARSKAQNVGGLVGRANTLNITMQKDIILTSTSPTENYGKIIASQTGSVSVGGLVGSAETATIATSSTSQEVKFQTGDMTLNSSNNICAGGLVGKATNKVFVSNILVNTQGEIKNKVMQISCGGNTYVGGLVGQAAKAEIKNCWSGTDVEMVGETETSPVLTGESQVSFGGIAGEVSDSQKDSISNNVSFGRFYLNSNSNIGIINAGGIVGNIASKEETSTISAITNNKSLTSLEIRRRATTHNVNAIAGSRDNNISGSGNAYTYQLSLAVESNIEFAKNCNTLSGVGVSDTNATKGSILNPLDLVDNGSLDDECYYQISGTSTAANDITIPDSAENFVLIGNGNTIKFTGSHINVIGSRTIISGVTIVGAFTYDVSGGNDSAIVTIDKNEYTYSSKGLTNGGTTYEFQYQKYLDNWEEVEAKNIKRYYYTDGGKEIYVCDENDLKDQQIKIGGIEYAGIIYANEKSYAISFDKTKIFDYSEETTYSAEINKTLYFSEGEILYEFRHNGEKHSSKAIGGKLSYGKDFEDGRSELVSVDINKAIITRKSVEIGGTTYEIKGDNLVYCANEYPITKGLKNWSVEITKINFTDNDLCDGVKVDGSIKKLETKEDGYYCDGTKLETKEDGYYLEDKKVELIECVELNNILYEITESEDKTCLVDGENKYPVTSETTITVENGKELIGKDSTIYSFNGNDVVVGEDITIGGTKYQKATIAGQDYVFDASTNEVARLLTRKIVKIGDKTYIFNQAGYFTDESGTNKYSISYKGSSGKTAYENAQGFVTTNNGFVSGVVVKSNYRHEGTDIGGFVTTNNGAILYSSMNGQVYATSGDVAGFVLENYGIIDYCHSTGAVQGNATNSYSFGKNMSGGALTNSYTITLNEANSTNKSVFANDGGKAFSNNEYDPIATELDQTLTGLSNKLTPNFDKTPESNGFWSTKGFDANETDKNNLVNYGYKTLSNGVFQNVSYLSINTGDGSNGNPYVIANSRLLRKINEISLKKSYILANNINLDYSEFTGGFSNPNWKMIGLSESFKGVFDGNNKTISNLTYTNYAGSVELKDSAEFAPESNDNNNKPSNEIVYGGMFAKIYNATIKNLILQNPNIDVKTNSNDNKNHEAYAGALVAYTEIFTAIREKSNIHNIIVFNATIVSSAQNKAYAGGLVGYSMQDSLVCGNVETQAGSVTAHNLFSNNKGMRDKIAVGDKTTWADGEINIERKSSKWHGFSESGKAAEYLAYARKIIGNKQIDSASSTVKIEAKYAPITQINSETIEEDCYADYALIAPTNLKINGAQGKTKAGRRDDRVFFSEEEQDEKTLKTLYSPYYTDGNGVENHDEYTYKLAEDRLKTGANIYIRSISSELAGGNDDNYISNPNNWIGVYKLFAVKEASVAVEEDPVYKIIYEIKDKHNNYKEENKYFINYVTWETDGILMHAIGVPVKMLKCTVTKSVGK